MPAAWLSEARREPRIHALVRLYRGVGLNLYLDFEEIEDE
jgi:hypothetical protein